MFGYTCMPLCKFLSPPFAQWTVGARPAPGLPCALFQLRAGGRSKLGRNKPRGCEGVSAMKTRAKGAVLMPLTPSLRAQRSNPESFRGGILDCFAALAMTAEGLARQTQVSCPGRCAARSGALQSRGPRGGEGGGFLGPDSAQQRKNAAARPRHARIAFVCPS